MRTYIYVDGFNFYYGAVKKTDYKWVNLKELFQKLLQSHHHISKIKYFTAPVSDIPDDPAQAQRQDTYLRAMKAVCPEFDVYFGHFLSHTVTAPLANPDAHPRQVRIIKTEEKGSDVNLAVHLLNDAWLNAYDCAVLVSNDSDMAESLRLVRLHHPCKKIGLITPGKNQSRQLAENAHFKKRIRKGVLAESQLPSPIPETNITKPKNW